MIVIAVVTARVTCLIEQTLNWPVKLAALPLIRSHYNWWKTPISLTNFPWRSTKRWFCHHPNPHKLITTHFAHGTMAVLPWRVQNEFGVTARDGITAKRILRHILNVLCNIVSGMGPRIFQAHAWEYYCLKACVVACVNNITMRDVTLRPGYTSRIKKYVICIIRTPRLCLRIVYKYIKNNDWEWGSCVTATYSASPEGNIRRQTNIEVQPSRDITRPILLKYSQQHPIDRPHGRLMRFCFFKICFTDARAVLYAGKNELYWCAL